MLKLFGSPTSSSSELKEIAKNQKNKEEKRAEKIKQWQIAGNGFSFP